METLTVIIEIALDGDDTGGAQARKRIAEISEHDDAALFVGDSEFLVVSARVES